MSRGDAFYRIMFYLSAIRGRFVDGELIEVRAKRPGGRMDQRFFPASDLPTVADYIHATGKQADVYVGTAPRVREHGGRDAIERVHVLRVDIDTLEARAKLDAFTCPPHFKISSGTGTNCHAYWCLSEPLTAFQSEVANKRLAFALDADMKSTDAPRILRPPCTYNFKHDPPVRTDFIGTPDMRGDLTARDVVGGLPDPEPTKAKGETVAKVRPLDMSDPLRSIPASEFVPVLTGRPIDRDGKVQCPFHKGGNERTPSLHAYDDPAKGWYCHGACNTGGDVYTLGAMLYGLDSRRDFPEIKRRLAADLLAAVAA